MTTRTRAAARQRALVRFGGELDAQHFLEVPEISVGGQDGEAHAEAHCAKQKVRVGALDTLGATPIEALSCVNVILSAHFLVGKCRKCRCQFLELRRHFDSGEKLLPYGTEHSDATIGNELLQQADLGRWPVLTASQSE